jgi:hypothetical protein
MGLRINRHNEIVDLLEKEASSKGFTCAKEQTYTTAEGQLLKPDLVLSNEARTLVVDVTVRYEREDWLARARSEKIIKYTCLEEIVTRRNEASEFSIAPIVIGSRGLVPKITRSALAQMGISGRSVLLTMSLIAIRTSLKIATAHTDYL